MAKKENNTNGSSLNLGEIGTIRNILMGDQMTEYELKFKELEERVTHIQAQLVKQVHEAHKNQATKNENFQKDVLNQIASLEKTIGTKENNLKKDIAKISQNTKSEIGKLLVKLGEQLLNE